MLLFRWAILLLLLAAGVSFAFYAGTGQLKYRRFGWIVLKWTLLAAYTAFRSGHALNNKLLRELLANSDAYEVVTFEDEKRAPRGFGEVARAW